MRDAGVRAGGSGVVVASIVAALSLAAVSVSAAPPKVNNLFPAGGQRGQSLVVTASGTFAAWPPVVWVDRSGVTIVPDKDKGKLNVQIAAEAVPGVYWLRLTDGEGAS